MVKKTPLLAIPLLFLVLGLSLGSRHYHWDTLERATLLENPTAYLRSWDGSPRSQFLSFAHVLELPLASVVRATAGFPGGMRSLIVFEALCAVGALLLVAFHARIRGVGLATTIALQTALACSWGFWKMGTSGEERILGLVSLLTFLGFFWRLLRSGRGETGVAATLAFAVLCHLSNAVLVPFAFLSLLVLPEPQRIHRGRALRALLVGSVLCAVSYVGVAAWTTGVRSPTAFWNYLTFFHRDTGNDFFGTLSLGQALRESWSGLQHFYAASTGIGAGVIVLLVGTLAWRRDRLRSLSLQARHLLLLTFLWGLHFTFYEPSNVESWTAPATALLLAAAWSLPSARQSVVLGGVAILLLLGNLSSFRDLHRPMPLQGYLDRVVAASAPGDILLLGGGIQNERPLRGSLATRYFLAFEKHRTVVSLYDILSITQPEYWGRPIGSPQELQQRIEAGQRVWFPAFLRDEFEAAQQSGLVQLDIRAHGDSLFEVTSIRVPTP